MLQRQSTYENTALLVEHKCGLSLTFVAVVLLFTIFGWPLILTSCYSCYCRISTHLHAVNVRRHPLASSQSGGIACTHLFSTDQVLWQWPFLSCVQLVNNYLSICMLCRSDPLLTLTAMIPCYVSYATWSSQWHISNWHVHSIIGFIHALLT